MPRYLVTAISSSTWFKNLVTVVSRYWLAVLSLAFYCSRYIVKRYLVTAMSSSAC